MRYQVYALNFIVPIVLVVPAYYSVEDVRIYFVYEQIKNESCN